MSNIIYVTVTATGGRGAAGIGVPVGGTTSQALVKNSATDYDTEWATVVPNGGTTGQILGKNSNLDLDTIWKDDKGAGLALDFAPAKTAGGVYLPTDFNCFYCTTNTTLTTSYPQLIPLSKEYGSLSISNSIITLTKGFWYEVESNLYGIGAGSTTLRFYDTANNNMACGQNISGSTDTTGRSNNTLRKRIDLTSSPSDLQIKLVNISLNGSLIIQSAGVGWVHITQLIKIPFTNL